MPILHARAGESDKDRDARRLREKSFGKALAKLELVASYKHVADEYIHKQASDVGIPMEMIKEEAPEAYARIEKHLNSKKKESKPESKPEPKAEVKEDPKAEDPEPTKSSKKSKKS